MPVTRAGKVWTAHHPALLLMIIVAGGLLASGCDCRTVIPLKLLWQSSPVFSGEIYIDGAVNSPGLYPLRTGDNIDTLLQAAGGITDNADRNNIRLICPGRGDTQQAQKIDINHAESWATGGDAGNR